MLHNTHTINAPAGSCDGLPFQRQLSACSQFHTRQQQALPQWFPRHTLSLHTSDLYCITLPFREDLPSLHSCPNPEECLLYAYNKGMYTKLPFHVSIIQASPKATTLLFPLWTPPNTLCLFLLQHRPQGPVSNCTWQLLDIPIQWGHTVSPHLGIPRDQHSS